MNKKNKRNILTYSGVRIDPLHPQPEEIRMEDIAHSLAMMCRANGHFKSFHSVAQHCIECAQEARARGYTPDEVMFCFLHDAAEAYLGDFVSPVKYRMEEYRSAEQQLLDTVYLKYAGRLPDEEEERKVKLIDRVLLYYEFEALMGVPIGEKPELPLQSEQNFEELPWRTVEEEYLEMFHQLKESKG